MNLRNAFTVVELVVVIAVIGILATLTAVGYTRLQKDTRDTEREADIAIIQSSLEAFYEKNGGYPSSSGAQFNESFYRNTLAIPDSALRSPTAPEGTTFSLRIGSLSAPYITPNNYGYHPYAYRIGEGNEHTGCGMDSKCPRYQLVWVSEADGTRHQVKSKYGW